ncbi:VanZ family protein [Bacillus sp. AL-1R]
MLTALYPSIFIILLSLFLFLFLLFRKKISILIFIYLLLFSIYISSLISITIFPFPFQKELIDLMIEDKLGYKHNFIPFYIFTNIVGSDFMEYGLGILIRQVIGNIILFMPLGFLLPILFPTIKVKRIFMIGLVTSILIEAIQGTSGYFIGYNYRAVDIDDLIFNFTGTVICVLIFKSMYKLLKNENLLLVKKTV